MWNIFNNRKILFPKLILHFYKYIALNLKILKNLKYFFFENNILLFIFIN